MRSNAISHLRFNPLQALAVTLSAGVCLWGALAPLRAQEKSNPKSVIRGTVRDQHNPLYGILVTAKAEGKNVETSVFTDEHGDYDFPPLAAGSYTVTVGTKWQQKLTLDSAPVKQDFTVELGSGFYNQTSGGSVLSVLPGTDGEKKNLVNNCGSCHSIWRVVDRARPNPEAWTQLVKRMGLKKGGPGSLDEAVAPRVDMSDQNFHTLVKYYTDNFTPNLKQGHVVEEMFRPRGEGARAVFTEWNLPKELGGITTAKPDSKGILWFPSGQKGTLGRLDPRTGELKTWPVPVGELAKGAEPPLHDIMIDKEDNVWLSGGGTNKVFKFDQKAAKFTTWDIPEEFGLKPHTGELDRDGNYWVTMQTGKPGKGWVVKLDTHTGKSTGFVTKSPYAHPYGPEPYGLVIDSKGTVWFTELFNGKLGKIDPKTGEMTEYTTPDPEAGPRRLTLDSKENLWMTECFNGKIAMFNPATSKFTEFDLGVAGGGFPYSIRVDKADQVWFSMNSNNSIGKLDPKTKKITYTLFPVPESTTIDPGFDFNSDPVTLVYGTHRTAVGRMYFRR